MDVNVPCILIFHTHSMIQIQNNVDCCGCNACGDVQKYFHDILNRVVGTVKDELVNILPHKWVEPLTIPLAY